MTELEIMAHAKAYLDQLVQGIDPLTGQPVGATDVVRQPRIAKCLEYVSGVLNQAIAAGGIRPAPTPKPLPFRWDPAAADRVAYSEQPLRIRDFCQRITAAVPDEGRAPLTFNPIANWLEQQGFLVKVRNAEGSNQRRPTPAGAQLGIGESQHTGLNGPYTAVTYDWNAQHYIVAHLPEILQK